MVTVLLELPSVRAFTARAPPRHGGRSTCGPTWSAAPSRTSPPPRPPARPGRAAGGRRSPRRVRHPAGAAGRPDRRSGYLLATAVAAGIDPATVTALLAGQPSRASREPRCPHRGPHVSCARPAGRAHGGPAPTIEEGEPNRAKHHHRSAARDARPAPTEAGRLRGVHLRYSSLSLPHRSQAAPTALARPAPPRHRRPRDSAPSPGQPRIPGVHDAA